MKKSLMVTLVLFVAAVLVGVFLWFSWYKAKPVIKTPGSSPAVIKPYVDEVFDKMTLKQKVASLFILHASSKSPDTLKAFMDQYQPGGFILMGDNIPTTDVGLKEITKSLRGDDLRLPHLVAIDEEGGSVKRLPGDSFPSAETLKNKYLTDTYNAFIKRSDLVASMGVNLNFGIIADVTDNPHSFIYDRVLGTTPQIASDNVRAAVGASRGRTLSTLKHFPGHGETTSDSHISIPNTNISYESWKAKDMLPFEAGIQGGADFVMFGHLRYNAIDTLPASLSRKWHDILRDDLTFRGIAITDDMLMLQSSGEPALSDPVANAIAALSAGNTLLLYVLDNQGATNTKIDPASLIDGVVNAVNNGKISKSLIDANARQVLKLRNGTEAITQNQ